MSPRGRDRVGDAAILLLVVGLPLLGAALAGRDLHTFFRFPPPLEIPSDYPRFSWLAAAAVVAALILVARPLAAGWRSRSTRGAVAEKSGDKSPGGKTPFPWWGWGALGWTLLWWAIAWQRGTELAGIRRFTFFPLWLGFIVSANACVQRRTGSCLMRRDPGVWLALFGVSACFWWLFEWLNRFVHNWHYLGVSDFGPLAYALHASLCFSTVLPAVAAVAEALGSPAPAATRFATGPRWTWLEHAGAGFALLIAGAATLLCVGAWPRGFYFALWIAPLAMFLGKDMVAGHRGPASEIARGDWSRAATWMIAALVCGFFWELWNGQSWPKWIYTVPGVERWHVFEMPLLGYSGYLPFGLECLIVVDRLKACVTKRSLRG
ncbi:MAG TPA: hypothetical protein VGD81_20355 [Opitutaceae bacterium]